MKKVCYSWTPESHAPIWLGDVAPFDDRRVQAAACGPCARWLARPLVVRLVLITVAEARRTWRNLRDAYSARPFYVER